MPRWLLPEGISDVLPTEARRIEDLRRRLLDLFRVYQAWKHGTGGRSGLHRAAQELTTLHREVRIRATETSLSS